MHVTGLAVNQTPAVARRIQQTADLVEKQPPTAMSAAVRCAVDTAAAALRQDYVDQLYEGDADASVTDLIALLDHPPFAEEVTAKLDPVAHPSSADAAVSAWHGSASDAHARDLVTRARH